MKLSRDTHRQHTQHQHAWHCHMHSQHMALAHTSLVHVALTLAAPTLAALTHAVPARMVLCCWSDVCCSTHDQILCAACVVCCMCIVRRAAHAAHCTCGVDCWLHVVYLDGGRRGYALDPRELSFPDEWTTHTAPGPQAQIKRPSTAVTAAAMTATLRPGRPAAPTTFSSELQEKNS